jgi:hypothetical protein
VKIRVSGTPDECTDAVVVLRKAFEVHEASGFYANRGDSRLGRVYVEAVLKPDAPVRADAARLDRKEIGR